MAQEHVERLMEIKPNNSDAEVELFLNYSEKFSGDVPDPYYEEGFDGVYRMVEDGIEGLLDAVSNKKD